jgi:hypothetical protein
MPRIPAHALSTRPLATGRDVAFGRYSRNPIGIVDGFEIACACVADNDNANAFRADARALLGIALVGPMMATLGMVVLMLALPG